MKQNSFSVLLAAAAAVTLYACEGEPPMTPANLPLPAASTDVAEEPSSAPTAIAHAATAPTSSTPPPTSSAEPSASASGVAPPPAPARGTIVGKVVAAPASMSPFAVVWLEEGPPDPAPAKPVSIDNGHMTFIPFIQVAPVGTKVIFSNSDPFPHNIFSPDNERFNLGTIVQHAAAVRVFKNPGEYALLCNLHPGMLGYLVVTPSTWFAKAGQGGVFAMKDVPAGTYKLTAWAPRNAPVTVPVTVKDGEVNVDFELRR